MRVPFNLSNLRERLGAAVRGDGPGLLITALVLGAVTALGVVLFFRTIDLAYDLFWQWPIALLSRAGYTVYRPLLTGIGFVAAWWLMHRFARGSDGYTVPDVKRAVAERDGAIDFQPTLARTGASAVTLGAGGAAGSEGPVAVLGAALGSLTGRLLRLPGPRRNVLVAAGTAAGISAAFNAPLAGAFFAIEEILGSLAANAFPPVVLASVAGAVVSRLALGNQPTFPIPHEYGYTLLREVLVFFPLLGMLSGVVGALFVRVYFGVGGWVARLPIGNIWRALLGGIAVGLLVRLSDDRLVGHGHLAVRLELFGRMPWETLLLLAGGGILATTLTLNSGGSGGLFTPCLFVGAALGGAVGVVLAHAPWTQGLQPEAYALVGMGAMVAAATGAPITGILLVFEMTNDYAIMPSLMVAVVIAHVTAKRLEPDTLYSGWLRRQGVPAHEEAVSG